jgi:hypothetical protein
VNLPNFQHGAAEGEIVVVLLAPNGTAVMLMQQCGGVNQAFGPANVIFDSASSTPVPQNGPLVSGSYQPTQYALAETVPAPGPQPPYATSFASLIGTNGNGSWSLWISSFDPIDVGSLPAGWSITLS